VAYGVVRHLETRQLRFARDSISTAKALQVALRGVHRDDHAIGLSRPTGTSAGWQRTVKLDLQSCSLKAISYGESYGPGSSTIFAMGDAVVNWILGGDPAIRWQALRDLQGAAQRTIRSEQRRVGAEGWGAHLLALQDADGRWAHGTYTPKWTSTTYTMLLLRGFGLCAKHPQALRACEVLLDTGLWNDGGINFWTRHHNYSETCVSSMVLAVTSWFQFEDERVDRLAQHVMEQQMPDGGWNCLATAGYGNATHGSFHTTISALEGLLEYERFRPQSSQPARATQARGREFLLAHRLYRSHRTGAVVKPEMTRFFYPPRWYYDVLRGLDYFRDSRASLDPRLEDGLRLIVKRRAADGRWSLPSGYPGQTFFELERVGEPSRWNTLRALRVLHWSSRI
jgi:hypothetical protein